MLDVNSLNDAQLDQAYASSYDARDYASANVYAIEIVSRMTTVGSFVVSIGASVVNMFGAHYATFPLYEARIAGGFTFASAASSSISTAAAAPFVAIGDIAGSAASAVSNVASSATSKILWVAGGLALVLIMVKMK